MKQTNFSNICSAGWRLSLSLLVSTVFSVSNAGAQLADPHSVHSASGVRWSTSRTGLIGYDNPVPSSPSFYRSRNFFVQEIEVEGFIPPEFAGHNLKGKLVIGTTTKNISFSAPVQSDPTLPSPFSFSTTSTGSVAPDSNTDYSGLPPASEEATVAMDLSFNEIEFWIYDHSYTPEVAIFGAFVQPKESFLFQSIALGSGYTHLGGIKVWVGLVQLDSTGEYQFNYQIQESEDGKPDPNFTPVVEQPGDGDDGDDEQDDEGGEGNGDDFENSDGEAEEGHLELDDEDTSDDWIVGEDAPAPVTQAGSGSGGSGGSTTSDPGPQIGHDEGDGGSYIAEEDSVGAASGDTYGDVSIPTESLKEAFNSTEVRVPAVRNFANAIRGMNPLGPLSVGKETSLTFQIGPSNHTIDLTHPSIEMIRGVCLFGLTLLCFYWVFYMLRV